jgi:hypothetical protein
MQLDTVFLEVYNDTSLYSSRCTAAIDIDSSRSLVLNVR